MGTIFPPKRKPTGQIGLWIILAVAEYVLKNDSLERLIQRFTLLPSASDNNVLPMHCARYRRRSFSSLRERARRCRCCCPRRGGTHFCYEKTLEPIKPPLAELPSTLYHYELSYTLFNDYASVALSLVIGFSLAGESLCCDLAECLCRRTVRHPMTKLI